MAVGPEIAGLIQSVTQAAKVLAEASSPRVTGEYAGSFEASDEIAEIAGHKRVIGVLTNTSGHAAAVEYGNANDSRAHHVLGRTLDVLHL